MNNQGQAHQEAEKRAVQSISIHMEKTMDHVKEVMPEIDIFSFALGMAKGILDVRETATLLGTEAGPWAIPLVLADYDGAALALLVRRFNHHRKRVEDCLSRLYQKGEEQARNN